MKKVHTKLRTSTAFYYIIVENVPKVNILCKFFAKFFRFL